MKTLIDIHAAKFLCVPEDQIKKIEGAVLARDDGKYVVVWLNLKWNVIIRYDNIVVACQKHTVRDWVQLGDDMIADMHPEGLSFWNKYKHLILNISYNLVPEDES